jgi:alkylation response protein AidB-like acyl-CoA dehydrogenase
MSYLAPLDEIAFTLNELAGLTDVAALPGCEEASPELVAAVLEEAAKLARDVLAPINHSGDREGSRLVDGAVVTPSGWQQAYQTFVEGGWNGLPFPQRFGGQGLPRLVATAVDELWHAANMSFALCPMLTQAAIEALMTHGSDALQQTWLPKMVGGEWAGTMNLTEPQAGSDLGAIRARAEADGDCYRLYGQKIFITYGDQDLTSNIVHMVLARLPDAPPGVKGISMFLVPKFLLDENGDPGSRNDVRTVSLEHKLGIHASPTCVLAYGDTEGAVGYLVGEPHRGLEYMFTMMNVARHAVGVEGLGIAERAYQQALAYARERIQGRPIGASEQASIIHHPDVQRMLMTMRCQVQVMRGLCYVWAAAFDAALRHTDAEERARQQQFVDLLTPVVKGCCTEWGNEVASLGVQVHGGMGYVEETGAAQHFRDARITTIYEGTTGIQANDLVGRKILRDQGSGARQVMAMMRDIEDAAGSLDEIGDAYRDGLAQLDRATAWTLEAATADPRLPAAVSFYYLKLWGVVCGGWLMAKSARAAQGRLDDDDDVANADFYRDKLASASFYATHVMPQAAALANTIVHGAEAALALRG